MLTANKFSDRGLFEHVSNSGLCSLYFHKEVTSEDHLVCQKYWKFYVDSRNAEKNLENIYIFFR